MISQNTAEDIRCLHFRFLIGTDSCCLPLVSLRILMLPEANDHHLTFPANWRVCICLGLKIRSSAMIMNYAVSASIMKISLVEKFLKFWKVHENILHPEKWQGGRNQDRLLLVASLYTLHASMHKPSASFSLLLEKTFFYKHIHTLRVLRFPSSSI